MKHPLVVAILPIFALLASSSAVAILASSPHPADPQPFPAAADYSIADLEWLTGHWSGAALGGDSEETWSAPAAGTMTGMFRLAQDGQTRVIEFITIEDTKDGVIYRFMHFRPDLSTWEDRPLVYRLVDADEGYAVFESGERREGTPRRLTYTRHDEVKLEVIVEGWEEDDEEMVLNLTLGTLGDA